MELQITTLIENMQDDRGELCAEHGLSLYIEFDGKKLLFDTGQTGDFLKNAEKLGKSVGAVDGMIVSHGHYDHSGGVIKMTEVLEKATPMYVGQEFFAPKYKKMEDGTYKYNGNPFDEEALSARKIILHKITEDITYLSERIVLFKNFKRTNDFEKLNPKFFIKTGEEYRQDDFRDEIALGLFTSKGLVLIVGCSHVGIVNILKHVTEKIGMPIWAVLGGTHLVEADEARLEKTNEAFRRYQVSQVAVSHCTGEQGIERMQEAFQSGFILNNTGNIFQF